MKIKYRFLLLILASTALFGYAQKITVSDEISVRNNFAYDIFPNLGDRIVFYHDKGMEHNFEVFDQNLRFLQSVDVSFEKKGVFPIGVIGANDKIHFYYSYKDTGYVHIKVRTFDSNMRNIDTTTLSIRQRKSFDSKPKFYFSEDKSKVLLLGFEGASANLMMIDNMTKDVIYDDVITIAGYDIKDDFHKLTVGNNGSLFMLCNKANFWRNSDVQNLTLLDFSIPKMSQIYSIKAEDVIVSDILLKYDNLNQRIALGGFVGDDDQSRSVGYFAVSYQANQLPDVLELPIVKFDDQWMKGETGKKIGRAKEFDNYQVRELVSRRDGGVLLTTETVKEYAKRLNQAAGDNFNSQIIGRGNDIDFYYEDIVIFANEADGKPQWDKLLFKKQFSQNDDAIYSSHFLFKTGGRLKFLYNDEIKNANTVSEYVLDPLGNSERKSVLSTEYQNLKLRFRDAIQTGPKSIIVPSEKNWKINMVKIEYD